MNGSKLRWTLSVSLWMCALACAAYAQGSTSSQKSVPVPENVLIEMEKAVVERDSLRRIVAIKDEQLAAKDEQIRALNALVDIQRMRAESWMKAANERESANIIEEKVRASYEQSLTDYRLRLDTAVRERDSARMQRWLFGGVGLVIGFSLNNRR